MAMESACTLKVGKDRFDGKVRMEADHIDFSGPTKYRFRLGELTAPKLEDDTVHFNFHGSPVSIKLASDRAGGKWIEYIQNPQTLADKLGIKEGHKVRVMNLDDSELMSCLEEKQTKLINRNDRRCDMVMLGVERASELQQLGELTDKLRPEGAVWVVLPKSVRTVTKANVHAATREAGLEHVEVIDFSETQAAYKIVRPRKRRKSSNGNGHGNGSSKSVQPEAVAG